MKKWLLLIVSVAATPWLQNSAQAELRIDFGDGGSGFTANVGESVIVPIFLAQSAPNTEVSDGGLISYGVRGTVTGELGPITAAEDTSGFDFAVTESFDSTAGTFVLAGSALAASSLSSDTGRVQLGTLTVFASDFGTSTITIGDNTAFADFVGGNPAGALDETIFGPNFVGTFSTTVTAVPEPSGFALGCLLTAAGMMRTRRQRRTTLS